MGEREYLLEPALRADIALIAARSADYMGNLVYSLTARNFNPLMAMAAPCVIAEPNEVVPVGVLAPDMIHTPGVLVDHLIERLSRSEGPMDARELIARRVALELRDNIARQPRHRTADTRRQVRAARRSRLLPV